MGEQKVSLLSDDQQMEKFVQALLADVQALEYMLDNDWFESDVIRIGAEQEMVLVDNTTFKPACIAMEALDMMSDLPWVETELAKFNLETNTTPRELSGDCFHLLETENADKLKTIQEHLTKLQASIVLTGILPTFRKFDLGMSNLTPKQRYFALMDAINSQQMGNSFELRLVGIDELLVKHDSPLLEACNTSFQVHLQVKPDEFVKMYNIAQALAAPVIAIGANSPLLFGKRLWHETRIALFQQALDTRTTSDHLRERSPRVSFGKNWLQDSILEIYKEDIARFRVLLSSDQEENSLDLIKKKKVPKLRALQVHNSTVYRWNRPCYGISENGKPHLRIENRVLPSGPTVLDEVANACFWLGCMVGLANEIDDVRDHMSFADANDNFGKSAKFGIDSTFTWFNDEKISACDLVLKKLLPIARKGLIAYNVDKKDIDKYLGIIRDRAKTKMNGARWMLRSYTKLIEQTSHDEALTVLTAAIIKNQNKKNYPVHKWPSPELSDLKSYVPIDLKVSEFMVTDLFTVQKDAIIELVAEMMDWRRIRFTPVEDTKGKLIGLVTSRAIIKHLIRKQRQKDLKQSKVSDIMIKNPPTISPDATLVDAIKMMKESEVGCLLVVVKEELIGVITEADFFKIAGRLLERQQEPEK